MCTQPRARSRNDPPSATEDVAKLRLHLRNFSLSELENEGLLDWNREDHVVVEGPEFDEIWPESKGGG